jgi:nucleoside-diphosphate-sugar epimerase
MRAAEQLCALAMGAMTSRMYATRPLWRTPIQLDNTKLVRFLGKEPHTPLREAVKSTLRGLNCIS